MCIAKSSTRLVLLILFSAALSACSMTHNSTAIIQQNQAANNAIAPATSPRILTKTVLAGQTIEIGSIHTVNPDCSSDSVGTIKITQQPMHGKAVVVQRDGFPNFPAANPRSACNTKKVPGMAVDYTPDAGFTGTDLMAIEAFFHSGTETNEIKFLINVK